MDTQRKILIVEDEGVIAMNLKRKLQQIGFAVTHVVDNSVDALQSIADNPPDLVLMDIVIQGELDGIETAQQLRQQQDIPVVFLTAHSDERTIERAKAALPYGYLIKPFEERELKTTIEMALYRHESQTLQRLQQQAIASATVGIAIADARQPEWPIVSCNPAFETAMGCPQAEAQGRGLLSLYGAENAEAAAKIESLLRNGSTGQVTLLRYNRDGRTLWMEITVSSVRDAAGRLSHHLVIQQDVTRRVENERHLTRTQRLEAVGNLVSGVAHDLNNVLAPIVMGTQLLEMKYPEASRTVEIIHASARRGSEMVRQLLAFARGSEGQRASIQLSHLLKEIKGIVNGTFPKNIELEIECDENLPTVLGDATQLHQVLLNLCVNARDAMPDGGKLSLALRRVGVDEAYASTVPEARSCEYVTLQVRDTGVGIRPEILDRIFEPFFSTKERDKGTGLGLSTVMGIVKGHGGFIQVASQSGKGSTFTAYLPAEGESSALPEPIEEKGEFRGQGELVLLVDDEEGVREVGSRVLEQMNFRPLVAADGMEALVQLAEHRGEVRAVITDLHMPNMDGLTFVRTFRRMLPDLPVIVTSGGLRDGQWEEFQELGVSRLLDKPFTRYEMAETLCLALRDAEQQVR